MNDIFDTRKIINMNTLLQELRKKQNNWLQALNEKPKLRTYIKFKSNFVLEEYVRNCNSRKQRSLLAQLCMRVTPLHVETGRLQNKLLSARTCETCNSNVVEDYIHFI